MPNATAFSDGQQSLTYAHALEFALKIRRSLRTRGVRSGDSVAIELPSGLHVVATCALFIEGVVTLAHREPTTSRPVFVADWLLTTQRTESRAARQLIVVDAAFLSEVQSAEPDGSEGGGFVASDSPVRIVYSSGTTGTPKAIVLTREMVHHRALAAAELFDAETAFLSMLDLATASGFHTLLACLMTRRAYLNPGDGNHNLKIINQFSVGAVKASPAQLQTLVNACVQSGQRLPSLRAVYSAGSVLSPTLQATLKSLSNARIFTLYGSSEAGRCAQRELTDEQGHNVGAVVPGSDVRIVGEDGVPLAKGEQGSIEYRRAHQAIGYLNDSELTAQVFRDGWFRTGDIGYLNTRDELVVLGRVGDIVNVGGVKVNLVTLDATALEIEGVVDAAGFVTLESDNAPQLALAVVLRNDVSPQSLVAQLKEQLGSQAPGLLFALQSIPRTETGKVRRTELAETYHHASAGLNL